MNGKPGTFSSWSSGGGFPDLHLTVTTDDEVKSYLQVVREELKGKYPSRREEIDAFGARDAEKVIIKNARVRSVCGVSERVLSALKGRGLALLRVRAPGKAFIIASRPVIQLGFKDGLGLMNEPTEMWLPIASDLAIGIGCAQVAETIYDLHDHRAIRYLNTSIAGQSTAFASRSASLTESIANDR